MEAFHPLAERHQRLRKQCLVSLILFFLSLVVTLGWFKGPDKLYGLTEIMAFSSLGILIGSCIWLGVAIVRFLSFRYGLNQQQKIKIPLLDEREKHQAIVVHVIGYWLILGFQMLEAVQDLLSGAPNSFTRIFLLIIPARWLYAENKLD